MSLPDLAQPDQCLQELIAEIHSSLTEDYWQIPLAHALAILHISREDFYRRLYRSTLPDKPALCVELIDPESAHLLIWILQEFGVADGEKELAQSGLYFSEDILLRWNEFFISVTMSRLLARPVDLDLLENSLSGCLNFEDGLEFYCAAFFDHNELIDFACRLFLERHSFNDHHFSRQLLNVRLRADLKNGVLRWEDIYSVLRKKLRDIALQNKFIKPEEQNSIDNKILSPEIKIALRELQLAEDRFPVLADLKKQYHDLMKRYHPDVNSEGLEKTRQINEAYTLLLGSYQSIAI